MKRKPTYAELETKIQELEREKKFEHDYLMRLLGSIPYGLYSIDGEYNIRYLNPVVEEKLGPIQGRKCYAYLHGRDEICPWCKQQEAIAGGSIRWDWCSRPNDLHYELFDLPFKNPDGTVAKMALSHEIIGLKWIEEAIQKNMRKLTKRVKELNCLYGISNLLDKKDVSLEEIYQGTVALLAQSFQHSEMVCARITMQAQTFETSNFKTTSRRLTRDIRVYGKVNGCVEVGYLETAPLEDEDAFLNEEKALIKAVAQRLGKITERKQAQKKIADSEQRFRDLIENSPCGITIIRDHQVIYRNPAQKRLAGALEDKGLTVAFENIHPDDAEMVRRNYQKLVSGAKRHVNMEFRFFPLDGQGGMLDIKWVACLAHTIEYEGRDALLINLTDITLGKKIDHIFHIQEKMTSLGRVAAGVAHEIRNPLSGINIYLNTLGKLSQKCENNEIITQILTQIQSASNKIEAVIKRVMDFSKPIEPHFILIDINQPIRDACNLSAVTLRKSGVQFVTHLTPDLPKCKADPHMIGQVILNLITNASESMQGMERNKNIQIFSCLQNGAIVIKVCDSGPGIPDDIIDSIFDPFYTTKNSGSGIGLSICHRIITDHGGSIQALNASPRGAEFIITMPINSPEGAK